MFTGPVILAFLALAVNAEPILRRVDTPLVTLQSAKRVNATGALSLLKRDQARAKVLAAKGQNPAFKNAGIVSSIPATNQAVDYTVTVRTCLLFALIVRDSQPYTDFNRQPTNYL